MKDNKSIYGLLAEFDTPRAVVAAAQRLRSEGYHRLDAYTPFPVEDLPEALGQRRSALPLLVLLGGITGGAGGYFMIWYALVVDYPLNVGGRPFHSWPAFIPITFELTILVAAVTALVGMLALDRLPRLHHPVFGVPGFERASTDRFFLCVEADDPKFNLPVTRRLLDTLQPLAIKEVATE